MKEVRIVILLSGAQFVSSVEYIPPGNDEGMFGHYVLDDPLVIVPEEVGKDKISIKFFPWIQFGSQKGISIGELAVTTTIPPIESIREAYVKQVTPSSILMAPTGMKIMK
jgi:hypothetical protein